MGFRGGLGFGGDCHASGLGLLGFRNLGFRALGI